MKPILLLLPEADGRPPWERREVDFCRAPPAGVVDDTEYDSVIVVNDGGVDAIRRLTFALALRQRWPALDVGVLTHLHGRALDWPPAAPIDGAPRLRIELRKEGLSLEYQEAD